MKTNFDTVNILWKLLDNDSSLKTTQKGGRFKYARPAGSTGEDLVINSLPISNELLQQSVLNVNIYAPNESVKIKGVESEAPGSKRLEELTKMVTSIIDDYYDPAEDIGFDVQQIVLIQDDTGEWYNNIRVTTYNLK